MRLFFLDVSIFRTQLNYFVGMHLFCNQPISIYSHKICLNDLVQNEKTISLLLVVICILYGINAQIVDARKTVVFPASLIFQLRLKDNINSKTHAKIVFTLCTSSI